MGFYELQQLNLPSVPWQEYNLNKKLDDGLLWTVRSAVWQGDDLSLPRLVGVKAWEAEEFAKKLLSDMNQDGIIIYYPYFIAQKSGTLEIKQDQIVIEAVKEDLWNMVTYSKRDVSYIITEQEIKVHGERNFLSKAEQDEILSYVPGLRQQYRDIFLEGKSILLEWSYAYNCSIDKQSIGDKYLVFYEIRTV